MIYSDFKFIDCYTNHLIFRGIQKNFVDMENMFELFHEKSDIKDIEGAPALLASRGAIEFRNVTFSYVPERTVLSDVSFTVQPGKTVALVIFSQIFIFQSIY